MHNFALQPSASISLMIFISPFFFFFFPNSLLRPLC